MVIIITLNKGTIEYLEADVTDRLSEISDLTPYTVQQRIMKEDDETTPVQDWTTVDRVDGMKALCLIDTTGWTDETVYNLYIKVVISPESPILGPFQFGLS